MLSKNVLSNNNQSTMATVKFSIQSNKRESQIYCRFSAGRGIYLKKRTGFTVNPEQWDQKLGQAKGRDAKVKALNTNLTRLDERIFTQFNKDISNGIEIDSKWLSYVIDDEFKRRTEQEEKEVKPIDGLVEYCSKFLADLDNRSDGGKRRGVSKGTKQKYTTLVKKLRAFDKYMGKAYSLKAVDLDFKSAFIKFLSAEEKISDNTIGRYVRVVKTIVLDARKHGLEVNPRIDDIKGFTVETPKVVLSFQEIDQIRNKHFERKVLQDARDWLVIGCFLGQRVSDLLRINTRMIIEVDGIDMIELQQVKTKERVSIPIHPKVREVLALRGGEFPDSFARSMGSASTLFNLYIKEVCREAGINQLEHGKLKNEDTGRYEEDKYEKFKLVSSHICRRSFATNFYAQREYPTPMLMAVTGHKTEKMFLEYIGKDRDDYSLQLGKMWANQ